MSSRRLELVRGQQVVQPLLIHHGEVVPLRQVEPEHAHAAGAHPVDRRVVAQVVEGQHQDRMPGVHARRRPIAPAGEADPGAERRERDRRRGAMTAVRRSARRARQGPLAGHRLAQLLAGLPALGRLLLQRPHDRGGQRPRAVGPDPLDRHRALRDVLGDHDPVGALEGRLAGQHLVGDDAEPVEVAPAIDLLAGRLLRDSCSSASRPRRPGRCSTRPPPPSPERYRNRPAGRGRCPARAACSPA